MADSFFDRPAQLVARELVGAIVVSQLAGQTVRGRVVETEAYLGLDDPASHAFGGRRYRGNQSIYLAPGGWYVYRSYGLHWCANLVTGPAGRGSAVLLRGVTIESGLVVVRTRRRGAPDRALTNGPGKLCQALAIDGDLDGQRMKNSAVRVEPGAPPAEIETTPRIGISKATSWPLRFVASALTSGPGRGAE